MSARAIVGLIVGAALLLGCNSEQGLNERRGILHEDAPTVRRFIRQDIDRTRTGVQAAAAKLAPGFLVEDHDRREREMRNVLFRLREPPRGIPELMVSPISFIAVVDTDGHVIARDATEDRMRGTDLARVSDVVRRALSEGVASEAITELPAVEEDQPASITLLFAAPARREGRIVGCVAAGLPLWRLSQQLSHQLQLEHAEQVRSGLLVWAAVYRGADMHQHAGFPADLLQLAPSPQERHNLLESSPGGYTGEVQQYSRWYGYGVLPTPSLGEDTGVILFRSDPM